MVPVLTHIGDRWGKWRIIAEYVRVTKGHPEL